LRNVGDAHIRAVIERGGLLSITFFRPEICGDDDLQTIVAMMSHIKRVHSIALGSDFDGSVRTPFDVTGLVFITQALRDADFSDDEFAMIMGGNVIRFWLENLP
jgi:microsomal dipeptidase-like Zn-dependent dipeptidase